MKKIILLLLLLLPFFGFSQLNSDKVIKSTNSAPYNTLQNALTYLKNNNGISAPVTLFLDNNENVTSTILVDAIPGSSATNTLTIKPNVGKTISIIASNVNNYTGTPATLKFNGAKNIIIDGSNTANGTTKDLTIQNNNAVDYYSTSVIWIATNGSDGSNNIIVKNTNIKYNVRNQPAKWLIGILSGNNGTGNEIATDAPNAANSNLTFTNNEFQNVREGICITSSTTENLKSSTISIKNNIFGNTNSSNAPTQGIYILNSKTVTIENNQFVGLANNDTSTQKYLNAVLLSSVNGFTITKNTINNLKINHSGIDSNAGITINGASSNGVISKNTISDIRKSSGGPVYGLILESSNTASNIEVSNNIISGVSAAGNNNNTTGGCGIVTRTGGNYKIYFNTIVLNSQEASSAMSAAMYMSGGTAIDLKNNIFMNVNATSGKRYAIYSLVGTSDFASDYNDFYALDNLGYLGSTRASLQNWKDNTGKDANSKNIAPVFSDSTLRLNPTNANNLTLIGQQVNPAITTDIDGDVRNAPIMGADEIDTCKPQGNEVAFGTTGWIGYVYNNAADTTNPPANPFATANYKGYVTENEQFDRNIDTGNIIGVTTQLCGTYSDHFAVRYKIRKSFPAGTYVFKVGGDDGYRLKVGTATVIDNFTLHSYDTTESAPITLVGNTELILEYYEDMTHSRVSFSYTYTPCGNLTAPTGIVQSVATTTCTTGDSVVLTAQGGTPAGTTYQWGIGSVAGTTPIAGETGASITVSPTTATTYWVRRFSNDACTTYSPIATINVTPRDRNISGTGEWIGYVYSNYTNNAVTPAVNDANYRGYITENVIFDRNIGNGPFAGRETYLCNAPSERFFVRYKMTLNLNADIYNFTVGGDDGYRLYIDGVLTTINNWNEHSYTTSSTTKTFATAGAHTFILEYYNGPTASHVSFTYNKREGDPTEFGNNVWNVYGYNEENIDIDANASSYAGYFVDPSLGINSENRWAKTLSPSAAVTNGVTGATGWAGGQIGADNFTVVHKRKGFPCGLYELKMDKWDDAVKIYLDGTLIFNVNGYNANANTIVGNYYLNSESKMEVRLREGGGDAYVKMTLTDKPSIYTSAGWSSAPENTSIVVSDNLSLTTNLNVCSCTVKAGKKLTIAANSALNVINNVVVESTGNIFVRNTGSLVQIKDDATFTGDVNSFTMERNTTPMIIYDFTYWSSPVVAQNLKTFSPLTLADKYYSFNGTSWVVENANTTNMTPGRGYIIRAAQGWNNTITNGGTSNGNSYANGTFDGGVFQGVFKGKANSGDINVPILGTSGSSNLIGNPYSSPVSVTEFMKVNSGKIDGNFYFWTHKNRVSNTPNQNGTYSYNSQDYAVYNKTGGVATSPIAKKPDGNIAAGQGFFVNTTTTGGNIVFKNSMRVTGNTSNTDFFRNGNTAQTAEENNRYWISLANVDGLYSEFLLGYVDGATNSIDDSYDGVTYSSGNVMLYTVISDNKLAIQGRQYPFAATDAVPVGYKVATAGQYTISINRKEGLFENQAIYLFDRTTNEYHDLRAGDFTFTSTAGTFDNRFEMRYVNETLGVDTPIVSNSDIVVYKSGNQIGIKAKNFIIDGVQVYDITGKSLFSKNGIDNSEFSTSGLNIATQVVIVKVTLDNNQTVSKKVIMN